MADELEKWRVLSSRRVVDDRWLRLEAERVRLPTGVELEPWYLAHGHSWACAVATIPDGRIVMVEQYRRGVDAWVLELPAGNIDQGEDPAVAAARELVEETGHAAVGPATVLGAWWPEPAHNSARAYGFAIPAAAAAGQPRLDAGELAYVRLLTPAEVDQAITAGRFCHAAQIAFWLTARGRGLA